MSLHQAAICVDSLSVVDGLPEGAIKDELSEILSPGNTRSRGPRPQKKDEIVANLSNT